MSYLFIDREIIIGEISYHQNLFDGATCGLVMYKKQYRLSWIQEIDNISDFEIKEITKPKCFIQRTGLGVIRLKEDKFNLFATTGKLLFKEQYEDHRAALSKAKIGLKEFQFSYYHSVVVCHIASNDYIKSFIKKLGFVEVHDLLSDDDFMPYTNFGVKGLSKKILDSYDSGHVSLWFNYFSKSFKNMYDVPIRDRLLYYFDSEWSLWDSQYIYDDMFK